MALRWKKNEPLRGLMRIGAGPRGSKLRDGDVELASVAALWKDNRVVGWFWTARNPFINTCNAPCPDEATAKAQAMAYVKKHRADQPTTTGGSNG